MNQAVTLEPSGSDRVAFDTDVLIFYFFYFRGHEGSRRFLTNIPHPLRVLPIPVYMELIQGCRNRREAQAVTSFLELNFAEIAPLTPDVSVLALDLLQRHALSHGLRTVDALIAATALQWRSLLATANLKHYRFIEGLRLLPFSVS